MSDEFLQRFAGIARLYGAAALDRFRSAHIAIIGIGGVGSWAAESLARSGIGALTLVDLDDLCVTNINRQIHALDDSVGRPKIRVMADRISGINPECRVSARDCFFSERTIEEILHPEPPLDAVIDAIDVFGPKSLLLAGCRERAIPVISCGAAGGRTDPSTIQTADLSLTFRDALLHQVRRKLRSDYGFPKGEKPKKNFGITAIFSSQTAVYPQADGCISTERPNEFGPGMRCDAGYGSVTHITATFGLFAAAEVLKALAAAQ